MLGHGAGLGYTGPGPRMGPTDNFSLVTGPFPSVFRFAWAAVGLYRSFDQAEI